MRITIKLFASFRHGRFKAEERDYPPETAVSRVVDDLDIPPQALGIVLINGCHSHLEQCLHDGDTLSLLPLMGGG